MNFHHELVVVLDQIVQRLQQLVLVEWLGCHRLFLFARSCQHCRRYQFGFLLLLLGLESRRNAADLLLLTVCRFVFLWWWLVVDFSWTRWVVEVVGIEELS
jgi:hypothetical protein